jgi:hypothetical protein
VQVEVRHRVPWRFVEAHPRVLHIGAPTKQQLLANLDHVLNYGPLLRCELHDVGHMHFGDHQQVVGCNGPVIRKCHKVVILWEKNIWLSTFSNNYLSRYSYYYLK